MSRPAPAIAQLLALALAVSACEAASTGLAAGSADTTAPVGKATPPQAAPLTASGPPESLNPQSVEDAFIQSAASVVRVDWVAENEAKMFGTAGGDPAMNGLYTYIAFFGSPDEGWTVFQLGDILDYTVLSSSRGRIDLDLHESTMNDATGEIGSRHRKVIVSWTRGTDDAPPRTITVTPAQ